MRLGFAHLTGILPFGLALALVGCGRGSSVTTGHTGGDGRTNSRAAAPAVSLETREQQINQTVWAKEMLAETCGRTFESLWDAMNAASNKLSILGSAPVGEIRLGQWTNQ